MFHEQCIRQWLTGFSNTCPTCRATVSASSPSTSAAGSFSHDDAPVLTAAEFSTSDLGGSPPQTPIDPSDASRSNLDGGPASPTRQNRGIISTNRIVSRFLTEVFSTLSIHQTPSSVLSLAMPSVDVSAGGDSALEMAIPSSPSKETNGSNSVSETSYHTSGSHSSRQHQHQGTAEPGYGSVGEEGCAAANALDDPTYKRLQTMYR